MMAPHNSDEQTILSGVHPKATAAAGEAAGCRDDKALRICESVTANWALLQVMRAKRPPGTRSCSGEVKHWEDVPYQEAVLMLGDDNFDEAISHRDAVLVFFYAPWCMHCMSVKRSYAAAAHKLSQDGFPGCMAAVNMAANPQLDKRFNLDFIPAFKLFQKGDFREDLHKIRNEDDFLNLMMKVMKSG